MTFIPTLSSGFQPDDQSNFSLNHHPKASHFKMHIFEPPAF